MEDDTGHRAQPFKQKRKAIPLAICSTQYISESWPNGIRD
jgi:hypothetical protein